METKKAIEQKGKKENQMSMVEKALIALVDSAIRLNERKYILIREQLINGR